MAPVPAEAAAGSGRGRRRGRWRERGRAAGGSGRRCGTGASAAFEPSSDSEFAARPADRLAQRRRARRGSVAPGRTPGIVVTSRPARPIVVNPIASGRLNASRVDPKTAIKRRQPVRRSRAASASESVNWRGRGGVGSARVAVAEGRRGPDGGRRSRRRPRRAPRRDHGSAPPGDRSRRLAISSEVVPRRARRWEPASRRSDGGSAAPAVPGQPRNSSIRPSSRPRRRHRPRWIRDLTVPRETPVISAISA